MEDMDIDQVPDTPDRLPGDSISGVRLGKESNSSLAGRPKGTASLHQGSLGNRLVSENGQSRRLQLHPSKGSVDLDAFEPQNKSSNFSSLEKSRHSENAPLFRRLGAVNNSKHESRRSIGVLHRHKWPAEHQKVPSKSHVHVEDSPPLDLTEQEEQNRMFEMAFPHSRHGALEGKNRRHGQTSANGGSSLQLAPIISWKNNDIKGKEKANLNGYSGSGSAFNLGKGIDSSSGSQHKAEKQVPVVNPSVSSPRIIGQKRLVRNGCISPHNIATRAEKSAENLRVGSSNNEENKSKILVSDRGSQDQLDINEIIAKDNNSYTAKGKRPMIHPSTSKRHDTDLVDLSDCNSVLNNKAADETDDASRKAASGRWRSTHNTAVKVDHLLQRAGDDRCFANEHREMKVAKRDDGSESAQNLVGNAIPKRQKKHGLTSRGRGECSTVVSDDSDVLFLGSSRVPSSSRSSRVQNRQYQATLGPIYEIDELSIGGRNGKHPGRSSMTNVDSDARARQLEADEALARELQEQLYNETPLFVGDEMDENIAWALQQEEDVLPGASGHDRRRSSSTAYSQRLPLSLSRSSQHAGNRRVLQPRGHTTRPSPLRSRLMGRSPTAVPRLRNRSAATLHRGLDFQFPLSMDLDMRLDILEELEAALSASHILQRDLNDNDYEMLLALDDCNPQTGASVNQINSLPESVVQTDNLEETCAICLESPAAGETIRHLPCLHKFHKDCIDPWLSRRTSCPVCKSSIT